MRHWNNTRTRLAQQWERVRLRLSATEAVLLMSVLGVVCGLLSGAVILLFRALVEFIQRQLLGGDAEAYETLPPLWRLLLPLGGAVLIGLYLRYVASPPQRQLGVIHVMGRVAFHQGYLPLRNAIHQFVSAGLSIISGHSVGREGPSVHLGAAAGSQLGQALSLPNNSLRVLVACGTAAAIGASFNTPLAGVAFAMEVVMMEYTISGFLPVILAAVSATALERLFFGGETAFVVPSLNMQGLAEMPYVVFTGAVIGVLAAGFVHLLEYFSQSWRDRPLVLRVSVGGFGVGVCALFVPEVMGIGYDTVRSTFQGELGLGLLLAVVIFKMVATSFGIGMGLPGGLIGPTLVIGAAAGGVFGLLANLLAPGSLGSPAFYALLGMGAMMGATLRAPLAALTAMLELTGNPNVIMPGMLAIATAILIAGEVFKKEAVFLALLRPTGMDPRRGLILQGLSRLGVARVMDRRLAILPRRIATGELREALDKEPRWILISGEGTDPPIALLPVTDVLSHLQNGGIGESLDLLDIPAKRLQPAAVEMRATLREALDILRKQEAEALYVVQTNAPGIRRYYGVVTRTDIESQYMA